MKPDISVILAVYNNEDKRLKNCLESLAGQKGVNYEVIVVDDGSYKKAASRQPPAASNFKFIGISHQGTAKARNFGARMANGRILVFVDGDMEFSPYFLAQLTKPIRQGKAKGTFSTEEFTANWENVWARCLNWENNLPDKRKINPKRLDMIKDFRAIKKSEFEKAAGFDDIGYTDTWTLSEKLGYRPDPVKAKYYHYNPDSLHEVFQKANWIGGRKRKFGLFGKVTALLRASLPLSFAVGTIKAIQKKEASFLIFKIVYDLGIFSGIIGSF